MRSVKRFTLISIAVVGLSAAVLGTLFFLSSPRGRTGETDSIVVAYAPFEQTTLLWIAEDRRFFSRNGLNTKLRKYDTGAASVDGMLSGEADVTLGVTEFPSVGRILKKERVRMIASVAKLDQIYLVGRRDRGIEKASDLKGKRVGTTLGTIAHFYLGRFLNLHGVNMKDITLVDVKTPEGWVNSVANGEIDAIATAQPYANSAKERLGANAVAWPAQGGQPLFGLIVSTDKWIKKHPGPTAKLLKSLADAEAYLIRHPAEARAIVRKRLNLDTGYMKTVWSKNEFSLSLDQSLVAAMEDQARWLIDNNLTPGRQVPDFLNYLYVDALKTIKPESVNVIK